MYSVFHCSPQSVLIVDLMILALRFSAVCLGSIHISTYTLKGLGFWIEGAWILDSGDFPYVRCVQGGGG